MCGAKRILELGTFTGFSAICLASGMGEGGHLDTLELNDELEDLILEGFERAGLEDVIQLHIGDCKETLKALRADMGLPETGDNGQVDQDKMYDIVYMDANKREYCEYYDLVFDMVRPGGLILADNVIWDGKVCQDPLPQDKQTLSIVKFNDMVSADPRVESVILPLRDGINVIRKK
jgi:predicted O-methyltransferase YrrM